MLLIATPLARARRALRTLTGGVTGAASPLAGRSVMITGASSGIGEATARAVAARGATVLLVARRADALARLEADIGAGAGADGGTGPDARVFTYAVDLTDGAAVDALVEEALADVGTVDYLVNNAGRSIRRSLDLTYDRFHDFERTMAINYFGPVRLTMGLLPAMRAQRFGQVVNVVTWGVQMKSPKFAAYIASKAALDVFGRIAGREAYRDNVTVTNMRFGLVATEMSAPTEAYARLRALSPEQAADRIVRALEERPVTVDVLSARLGELANIVAPRLSDFAFSLADRAFADSAAARAGTDRDGSREPTRRG